MGLLEWLGLADCLAFAPSDVPPGVLNWIENTRLAECVRSSSPGYPSMIGLHALGMAIMVGLSLVIDLRLVGFFRAIPVSAMYRLFGLAWIGFGINFLSGSALFTAQAVSYMVDWIFLSKMTLVFLGAITAAILQPKVAAAGAWPDGQAPGGTKAIAGVAIVIWVVAIILGRLTAYL